MAVFVHQEKGGCNYSDEEQRQSNHQTSLTHGDLWHWLHNHGVPSMETERVPTKSPLCLCKKSFHSSKQMSSPKHRSKNCVAPQSISSLESVCRSRSSRRKGSQVPLRKDLVYSESSPALSKGTSDLLQGNLQVQSDHLLPLGLQECDYISIVGLKENGK